MTQKELEYDLSGPSRSKRLARLESLLKDEKFNSEVAQILISIENVPSNITEYRDRERYLENLLTAIRKNDSTDPCRTNILVFRYLLGSLYVNFEKFWGPTIRVIIDLLNQSKFQNQLLERLLNHLDDTNAIIYDKTLATSLYTPEDRPDHILHRNFLFQIMNKFVYYIEAHSAQFMNQYFRFVHEEILVSPFIEKFTRSDLSKNHIDKVEDREEVSVDLKLLPNTTVKDNHADDASRKSMSDTGAREREDKRKSRETFITATKIIQSFKDINKVHREAELNKLILDLLCCRDSSVQKSAFNCVLAYDHEYIRPYTDKLLKIMNDKMVRTELLMFSVDEDEAHQIKLEHRDPLMPILLRILFGKMIGKVGKKSAGPDKSELRKGLIMRYIGGCSIEEILYFFDLLFNPLFEYTKLSHDQIEVELKKNFDLGRYIPLNKLHAMLDSLSAFMESVAHLKEESLSYVLKMINIVVYLVVAPMEDTEIRSRISPKNLDLLKALKRECFKVTNKFFSMFEYYRFEQSEINFIFKYLIWTSTQGFVDRNYAQPTPLLRLIESFSSNTVYHKLLVKRNKANLDEYLLCHVIDLYSDSKTTRVVLKFVAKILADIIQPGRKESDASDDEDGDGGGDVRMLSIENPVFEDEDAVIPHYDKASYKIDKQLAFNQEILIAFIPRIFDRLKTNCQDFLKKKDVDSRIENNELVILSSLSEFLKNSDQSLLGARLLVTTLAHQKKPVLIHYTLKTAQTLLKQVEELNDPEIVNLVADVIGYQRNIFQRKELCTVLEIMSNIDVNLASASSIIRLMNETNTELADLPDLTKWNEGFQLAFQYIDWLTADTINQPEVVIHSLNLLLHQVGFIINNVDRYEFSIRENCITFFEKLGLKLKLIDKQQNNDLLQFIIVEILLEKYVKKGLRETNEVIKNTFIGILRTLAVHCHEKNKILGEFYLFCSDNSDIDFWQNIRHIQLHNRSRALARLVAHEKIHEITPKTLSSYFMPLAAGFLFSKAYKSVSNLSENSIKLIGIICKHLNWVTYESTLSYYLDLLTKANATYQRTNIKLITEILKNFHFDLSACEEAMQYEEENAKLEKRMRKRRGAHDLSEKGNPAVISTDAPTGKRLNPSTARMVYYAVTKKLLPRLNSCLHEMTRVEFEHDKNMSDYLPEKEEIKRIPIAFAIVQLLNLLPGRYVLFRDNLPPLFLKLSSFLKSKNESIRKAARQTLIKVMNFVGPAYVPDLLRTLKQNLDKGFQIHVLNYTIHSVLDKLPLRYGDLDQSIQELVNSCFAEIFGKMSEDKEIAQILAKTFEAKKTKSYDTLLILASNISAEKLDYLMNSIKETLKTSNDPKKVNKLSVCVQKVFSGLSKNEDFPIDKMLSFIHSTIEESIPCLKVRQKVESAEKPTNNQPLREDRYIIEKSLSRDRVKSKINEKGNLHMVVENCLRLLLHTFEKSKTIIKRKENLKKQLDGFIKLLSTCLKSSSPKCVTRSLKCIYFIAQTKSDLPTFKLKCNSIVKKIFILLNLYNGVGMVQGDNFEMILMCFKTLTLLLLRCEHVSLSETQVRALLSYIEQDLHDSSRQATAFGTLNSLLHKKCESPELLNIMTKVADLLVTSDDEKVRSLSVKIWQTYLLDYKHEGKLLQSHLTKFLRQLDYEFIDGRKSVLNMLNVVIAKFPENLLRDHFELMFHLLAQRLVNEESKDIEAFVGKQIGLLIQRLPEKQTHVFNKFIIPWASDSSVAIRLLGTKLMSVFVDCCKSVLANDKGKIKKILSLTSEALEIKQILDAPSEPEVADSKDNESSDIEMEVENVKLITDFDKLHHHSLELFHKLLTASLVKPTETRYIIHLKKIWHDIASTNMSHWHLPIVLISCQLYSIFIKVTSLSKSLDVENPSTEDYLDWNAKRIVRTLCDKYLDLLDRADESEQLLSEITEAMVRLGQMITHSRATINFESEYTNSFENGDIYKHLLALNDLSNDGFVHEHLPYSMTEAKKRLDLMWLSTKVVMQARKEAALFRLTKNFRRNFVLKWTAAISQELGARRLAPYALLFIMTPIRELTDKGKIKSSDSSSRLQNTLVLSEDLLKFIKGLVGVENFNKIYSKVQLHYTKKRIDRKKNEAVLKVKDQVRGVKRKIKQLKDKDTKRKKTQIAARKKMNGRVSYN